MITFERMVDTNHRLGNQLFRIAAVYGYARRYGHDFLFKEWPYNFLLAKSLPINWYYPEHTKTFIEPPVGKDFGRRLYKLDIKKDDVMDLYGYFQNELYFKEYTNDLYNLIRPSKYVRWLCFCRLLYWRLKRPLVKYVSLHVRRGDYVTTLKNNFYELTIEDYYRKAIEMVCTKIGKNVVFAVNSDDIDWCRSEFTKAFGGKYKFIYVNSIQTNAYVDMIFFSNMDGHIICNSTYPWWVAWFGERKRPGKLIVAPKRWFGENYLCGDLSLDLKIVPDRWISI